jgi:hypothetical protein
VCGRLVEVYNENPRTFGCQLDRDGSPYSHPCTGHQCGFSFQLSHSFSNPNPINGQFRLSITKRPYSTLARFVLSCAWYRPQTQMDYSIYFPSIYPLRNML